VLWRRSSRAILGPLLDSEILFIVCTSTMLVMLGQGIVGPILPLYAKSFGVSAAAIGLTLSVFAAARMIFNIPSGILADRWGRKVLLVGGPVIAGAGNLLSGTAPNFELLLVWRFLAGVGSAIYMTGAIIVVTDIATNENRGRMMALNQSALLLGVTVGPAIGGVLAEVAGLRAPFWAVGVATLAAAVWNLLRVPETRPTPEAAAATVARETAKRPAGASPVRTIAILLSLDFLLIGLVNAAVFFGRAGRSTLLPLFGDEQVGLGAGAIGAVFALMAFLNLVLTVPAGSLIDRFGAKAAILPSAALSLGAYLLFIPAESAGWYVLAACALGVSSGILGPAPAAYAAEIAPPGKRGAFMGLFRTVGDVGFVIGPPLVGFIIDRSGFSWALATIGVLLFAPALAFALFGGRGGRASAAAVGVAVAPGAVSAARGGRDG
jgi:multidrug resistance protein